MLTPRVERIGSRVAPVIRPAARPRTWSSGKRRAATLQNARPKIADTASVAIRYPAFRTTGVRNFSRHARRESMDSRSDRVPHPREEDRLVELACARDARTTHRKERRIVESPDRPRERLRVRREEKPPAAGDAGLPISAPVPGQGGPPPPPPLARRGSQGPADPGRPRAPA